LANCHATTCDAVRKGYTLLAISYCEKRAAMTRAESALLEQIQDRFLKLEKPKRVGNGGAVLTRAFCNLFLREMKLIGETLECVGLLDWVEVLALKVFNQGHLKSHGVRHVPNHNRNAGETGLLSCTPATFAGDELVAGSNSADDERLDDSAGLNRPRKFVERFFAEAGSRLIRARIDQVDVDLKETVIRS
jgi:hypothetical protein